MYIYIYNFLYMYIYICFFLYMYIFIYIYIHIHNIYIWYNIIYIYIYNVYIYIYTSYYRHGVETYVPNIFWDWSRRRPFTAPSRWELGGVALTAAHVTWWGWASIYFFQYMDFMVFQMGFKRISLDFMEFHWILEDFIGFNEFLFNYILWFFMGF